jgi:putative ABC transport system ATP-binding protein
VIRLDGVSRIYRTEAGDVHALRETTLEAGRGEFIAIMGPSGSGKSTLMNVIGLLDRPSAGTYSIAGRDVGRLSEDDRARLRGRAFGFVFQSYNLLPRLTALEQVELPLIYQAAPNRRRRAAEALVRVGLGDRAFHLPNQLSGGQQQRVAIARSLVVNPLVLLADEPTGALDTTTSHELMELLTTLVEERGLTVLIVTHEEEVAAYARRVILMRDGEVVEDRRSEASHPSLDHAVPEPVPAAVKGPS